MSDDCEQQWPAHLPGRIGSENTVRGPSGVAAAPSDVRECQGVSLALHRANSSLTLQSCTRSPPRRTLRGTSQRPDRLLRSPLDVRRGFARMASKCLPGGTRKYTFTHTTQKRSHTSYIRTSTYFKRRHKGPAATTAHRSTGGNPPPAGCRPPDAGDRAAPGQGACAALNGRADTHAPQGCGAEAQPLESSGHHKRQLQHSPPEVQDERARLF
eukprot:CAMPEP_0176326152 /NCGR_PEP_ID=MMETSP0121_2-20121125/73780_1 /TAXON_ID=160619 /ORGANISM="Kryptoperidinium foliaceum, Strain CCMP 1326" /LENGTH=212 /DNA_ID=CAMNT_0017668743 /DNA_START=74 /DNA_END=710 /DNA_ORIENTATION=-